MQYHSSFDLGFEFKFPIGQLILVSRNVPFVPWVFISSHMVVMSWIRFWIVTNHAVQIFYQRIQSCSWATYLQSAGVLWAGVLFRWFIHPNMCINLWIIRQLSSALSATMKASNKSHLLEVRMDWSTAVRRSEPSLEGGFTGWMCFSFNSSICWCFW